MFWKPILGTFLVLCKRQQVILPSTKAYLCLGLCHLPRAAISHLLRFLDQSLDQSHRQCCATDGSAGAEVSCSVELAVAILSLVMDSVKSVCFFFAVFGLKNNSQVFRSHLARRQLKILLPTLRQKERPMRSA